MTEISQSFADLTDFPEEKDGKRQSEREKSVAEKKRKRKKRGNRDRDPNDPRNRAG